MDAHSVSSASRFSSSSSSVISTSRNKPNNRIGSKMNIALSVLPSFIKVDPGRRMTVKIQRQDSPDERTPSPLHKRNDSFEKASLLRSLNRSKTFGKKLNFFEGMLEEYQDYIDYLRTETEKNKPVMKINNILLTAQDFLSIIDPVKFTRTALDACLTLMKKLNYEALTRDEAHSNITVSSTAFAWKIFNEEKFEDLHAPSYIFPYNLIYFPIYIGQWGLLEIDTNDLIVHFYSLCKPDQYLESILINCYQFLQQEYFFHKGGVNDLDQMRTLRYESVMINTDLEEIDSAVFILMRIMKSAVPKSKKPVDDITDEGLNDEDFTQNQVQDFKDYLARLLIDNSEKLNNS